jgi:hypothetical protein
LCYAIHVVILELLIFLYIVHASFYFYDDNYS